MERSLAECMKFIVPMVIVILPSSLFICFIAIQINNMYSGDWVSFKENVFYLGGLFSSYILGSAPKSGLLGKFW